MFRPKATQLRWFLAPLLFSSALFAQFDTAEVLGTVKDASGATVPHASVTLLNQSTGIASKMATGDDGGYDFFNVRVGKYTVTVEATGFQKVTTTRRRCHRGVPVSASTYPSRRGNVSQSVEVTGAAAQIETDNSQKSQVIATQAIVELPLNGRDYASLALLSTNVHISPIATSFSPSATPREGAFNVNGMRSTYNNFLLDGVDNNSYGTSNPELFEPGGAAFARCACRIFRDCQQLQRRVRTRRRRHRKRFAALRQQTRSMAPVYEFLRNTDLNATGYFRAAAIPTLQSQSVRRHHRRSDR